MKKGIVAGIALIVLGIGMLVFYEAFYKEEREARVLLTEAKLIFERENRHSINSSIDLFSKIAARYPDTASASEAYYHIARGYEKLGLNKQAYYKYIYLLKNKKNVNDSLLSEINARLAGLKIKKVHTEEGVHQLLGLLNESDDRNFRSRVYAELGHTYLRGNESSKASRMFDISLNEDGENEEAIIGKARSLIRLGKAEQAYDLYEQFLRYFGNFSQYSQDVRNAYLTQVYASGINSYKRGSYWQSIGFFNRLLKYFPGDKRTENALYWMGESYFSLGRHETALQYFGKTLSNQFYHKDEDARMKRGYTYFMLKRFDLAAREFQIYLDTYPHGRHAATAGKWRNMSGKEINYRAETNLKPADDYDDEEIEDNTEEIIPEKKDVKPKEAEPETNNTVKKNEDGEVSYKKKAEKKVYENIAEI
jgi:TolA-binding protein